MPPNLFSVFLLQALKEQEGNKQGGGGGAHVEEKERKRTQKHPAARFKYKSKVNYSKHTFWEKQIVNRFDLHQSLCQPV